MKLLTFSTTDGLRWGVKTEAGVVDIALARAALEAEAVPESLDGLLEGGQTALDSLATFIDQALDSDTAASWLLDEASLDLGPCVPHPQKIICIGLNYRRHAEESGMAIPTVPILFAKYSNTLTGSGQSIPLLEGAVEYDYEVELGAVIGRRTRNVSETEALDRVFGYCIANDLSARDLQMRTNQWLLGKTPDKFMPLGPYLVSADEINDPQDLNLRCWVNGELRQDSNTSDMIFSVAQIISYVSQYMTLEPGDVISTGTPEGVILGMAEKNWLKAGDEMAMEIPGFGPRTICF